MTGLRVAGDPVGASKPFMAGTVSKRLGLRRGGNVG